jgi:hypothetical protein
MERILYIADNRLRSQPSIARCVVCEGGSGSKLVDRVMFTADIVHQVKMRIRRGLRTC